MVSMRLHPVCCLGLAGCLCRCRGCFLWRRSGMRGGGRRGRVDGRNSVSFSGFEEEVRKASSGAVGVARTLAKAGAPQDRPGLRRREDLDGRLRLAVLFFFLFWPTLTEGKAPCQGFQRANHSASLGEFRRRPLVPDLRQALAPLPEEPPMPAAANHSIYRGSGSCCPAALSALSVTYIVQHVPCTVS